MYMRELQVKSQIEEVARKEELLREQHFEITQESKKLQVLTNRYEEMLEKEMQIQQIAQQIMIKEAQMDNRELAIDKKLKMIEKERHDFKQDRLCSLKIEKTFIQIKDQN